MPSKELPMLPRLSKSKYISGNQCHKKLYLEIHSPELATEFDKQAQAIMDMGTEVGELARKRFPGGVLVAHDRTQIPQALQETAALIRDPSVTAIYEGTFKFDDVLVRVDVLERVGQDRWRLIEVKASGGVKGKHLPDLAIQTYVLNGAGVPLSGSWLMHLNTKYVYPGGNLDLDQLFTLADLTEVIAAPMAEVTTRLAALRTMLAPPTPPAIEPGYQCEDPHSCQFWDHCTKDKPERWIFNLPGGRRTFDKLVAQGVTTIDEIPPTFKLARSQQLMKDNVEWTGPKLARALKGIHYPVHHLDFETFAPAIPQYPNTRPYQAIPFQWSNHVETEDGKVRHDEYLCTGQQDPREELAKALLASLGQEGSICAYSGYEKRMITDLAAACPSLRKDLEKVSARLVDLHPIVKSNYYHPQFNGSFSIKDVLEAVAPTLSYKDLKIQGGTEASQQYYRMIFEEIDAAEKERILLALLKYCERDTLAMVELRKTLLQKTL
jgi:predicted RecB family nuclease